MPEGVIQGGWSSVLAAYGLTALVWTGYVTWLLSRLKAQEQDP